MKEVLKEETMILFKVWIDSYLPRGKTVPLTC